MASDVSLLPGRFWPGPPRRGSGDFDEVGSPFVLIGRHLPTPAERVRAETRFGPAALPMFDAWREAWEQAVDDIAAFEEALPSGQRPHSPGPDLLLAAERVADISPAQAADLALLAESRAAGQPHRDSAFHVMEDAHQATALIAAGVPFDIVLAPLSTIPAVVSHDPGLGMRLLDWKGADDEQDRHAKACRRARQLLKAANPYWESPAFRSAAGREMAVADRPSHLAAILRDMRLAGHRKAFLKSTSTKGGTWVADIDGADDLRSAGVAAHAAMGPAYAAFAAATDRSGVLVQEFVPFTHEHRFLVAGHRIVASTASDRDLGPLDRHVGRILHPAVARLRRPAEEEGPFDRGDSDAVRDRALVAGMAAHARRLVRAFRREGMLPDCYCIDMGLGPRGVLPIEVNTAVRCGIYAADWDRFARALARRPAPPIRPRPGRVAKPDRDRVEDAFEFMLDILCDEPPRRLREVGERLLAMSREPEAAVEKGAALRALNEGNLEEMPRPGPPPLACDEDGG